MNHLNSYNESVRDLMTPKTKDELNIPMRKLFKEDPIQFFYKYHMTYSEMNVIFSEEEIRSVMDKFTESLSWAIVNVNSEELKEVVWYLYKNNYVFIRVGARDFLFKHKTRDIEHGGYFQVNRSTTLNDVKSFIEGLNESVRDMMKPKSPEDVHRILSSMYYIKPEIYKFLTEAGYKFAMAHMASYDLNSSRMTFEFYNKEVDWRIYFHPNDTLETIKEKVKE